MQVYLINLDRATERLAHMQQAFDAAGISFTRISAVDGHALSDSDIKRFQSREGYWGWLTPGEIGCFLSHRLCWQAIADGDDRYGIIFEDDMLLGADASSLLSNNLWIPDDADVIKMEAACIPTYIDCKGINLSKGRELNRLRFSHYCSGAYIISTSTAKILLKKSKSFSEPIDEFIFNVASPIFSKLKIYQMVPALCIQQRYHLSAFQEAMLDTSIPGRTKARNMKFKLRYRWGKIVRELHSGLNKLLCRLGKRERIVVDFK